MGALRDALVELFEKRACRVPAFKDGVIVGHISGSMAIHSGNMFKSKDERLKELDAFVSRRGGGQRSVAPPAATVATADCEDLDSDSEMELMTSLLTGTRVCG